MRQAITLPNVEGEFERVADRSTQDFDLFWKEAMPEGVWKHPVKDFTLDVTPERLQKWVSNFNTFQKPRNIDVAVPHGHTYDTKNNAGFVEEMEVRENGRGGKSLFTLLNIPKGEDSGKIGSTIKQVSISLNPDLKFANGQAGVEEIGECVEHVALTNYPAITGMGDFIAFDSLGEKIDVIQLSTLVEDSKDKKPQGAEDMKVSDEQLRQLEKKFSFEANSLTNENYLERLASFDIPTVTVEKIVEKPVEKIVEKIVEKPGEVPQFDVTKDPSFIQQQDEIKSLKLDRNQQRLSDISRRLDAALTSGRLVKAAFDKLVPQPTVLQFDRTSSIGMDFDTQCDRLEWALAGRSENIDPHRS